MKIYVIGSTSRNSGKTTLAVSLIQMINDSKDKIGGKPPSYWLPTSGLRAKDADLLLHHAAHSLIGLKLTVTDDGGKCAHGGKGCGACSDFDGDFCILEEKSRDRKKDTGYMLAAGAERVFWVRTKRYALREAFDRFLSKVSEKSIVVCESNSVTDVVTPDCYIVMHNKDAVDLKPSAEQSLRKADFVAKADYYSVTYGISLAILAGGKSSRMGQDKALLSANGRSFLETLAYKGLCAGFSEVLVSNHASDLPFVRLIPDEYADKGPVSGIYSCLLHSQSDRVLFIPVDAPDIDFDDLVPLIQNHIESGKPATIAGYGDDFYPTIGIYEKSLLEHAKLLLETSSPRIMSLFQHFEPNMYPLKHQIVNINTEEDFKRYAKS